MTETPDLPLGRYVSVFWAVKDDFGGMTAVMFDRSRRIHEYTGRDVDVVLLSPQPGHRSGT